MGVSNSSKMMWFSAISPIPFGICVSLALCTSLVSSQSTSSPVPSPTASPTCFDFGSNTCSQLVASYDTLHDSSLINLSSSLHPCCFADQFDLCNCTCGELGIRPDDCSCVSPNIRDSAQLSTQNLVIATSILGIILGMLIVYIAWQRSIKVGNLVKLKAVKLHQLMNRQIPRLGLKCYFNMDGVVKPGPLEEGQAFTFIEKVGFFGKETSSTFEIKDEQYVSGFATSRPIFGDRKKQSRGVKVVVAQAASSAMTLDRQCCQLLKEAVILKHLDHPNIQKLIGFLATRDKTGPNLQYRCLLVTENFSFGTLHKIIEMQRITNKKPNMKSKKLMVGSNVINRNRVLYQLTNALCYLDANNVVHGAVCVRNVYLNHNLSPKLFNFAFAVNVLKKKTPREVIIIAKPMRRYCAPEILFSRVYSPKSDVYALGLLAYHLYQLVQPYASISDDAILSELRKKWTTQIDLEGDTDVNFSPFHFKPDGNPVLEKMSECVDLDILQRLLPAELRTTLRELWTPVFDNDSSSSSNNNNNNNTLSTTRTNNTTTNNTNNTTSNDNHHLGAHCIVSFNQALSQKHSNTQGLWIPSHKVPPPLFASEEQFVNMCVAKTEKGLTISSVDHSVVGVDQPVVDAAANPNEGSGNRLESYADVVVNIDDNVNDDDVDDVNGDDVNVDVVNVDDVRLDVTNQTSVNGEPSMLNEERGDNTTATATTPTPTTSSTIIPTFTTSTTTPTSTPSTALTPTPNSTSSTTIPPTPTPTTATTSTTTTTDTTTTKQEPGSNQENTDVDVDVEVDVDFDVVDGDVEVDGDVKVDEQPSSLGTLKQVTTV